MAQAAGPGCVRQLFFFNPVEVCPGAEKEGAAGDCGGCPESFVELVYREFLVYPARLDDCCRSLHVGDINAAGRGQQRGTKLALNFVGPHARSRRGVQARHVSEVGHEIEQIIQSKLS